jgi:hypothetical protein
MAEMALWRLAMTARLCQSLMTEQVVSSGAPAPRFTLVVAVQAGTPPPSVESAQEVLARRIDGGVLL